MSSHANKNMNVIGHAVYLQHLVLVLLKYPFDILM